MAPLLQVVDLEQYFKVGGGYLHAVDGVSFSLEAGQTLGVVGESGCGKSTLGRTILQLIPPTGGNIIYEGRNVAGIGEKGLKQLRKEMQIIFQDPYSSLDPRMSVFELIAEPLVRNHVCKSRKELEERIFHLMETVGLDQRFVNTYPHEMDGGRRQRVGIARALALQPKFIVCDEPVSALDVSIQAQILNLLMDLQEKMGLTYMFITHDLSVVKHISDEIMVMYLGQCVEKAPSGELFRNPMHPYTKALLSAIPIPKPGANRKRKIIRGEVPNPVNPKPGCRFASRCEYCTAKCTGADIPLRNIGNGHWLACNLYPSEETAMSTESEEAV